MKSVSWVQWIYGNGSFSFNFPYRNFLLSQSFMDSRLVLVVKLQYIFGINQVPCIQTHKYFPTAQSWTEGLFDCVNGHCRSSYVHYLSWKSIWCIRVWYVSKISSKSSSLKYIELGFCEYLPKGLSASRH